MQFKQTKTGMIQLLAYQGYDKDKKRAIVKLIGTFSAYLSDIKDVDSEIVKQLTVEQIDELKSWLSDNGAKMKEHANYSNAISLNDTIKSVLAYTNSNDSRIESIITEEWAKLYYEATHALDKQLKKMGYKKTKTTTVAQDVDGSNL
jgi:hypothetical protein